MPEIRALSTATGTAVTNLTPITSSYVGTNPEVGGSTPFQMTLSHKLASVLNPAGDITVRLPTTNVKAGETVRITNRSTNIVTVQSSGANDIDLFSTGSITVVALQDTPTSAAHWHVLDVKEAISFTTAPSSGAGTSPTMGYVRARRDNGRITVSLSVTTGSGSPSNSIV